MTVEAVPTLINDRWTLLLPEHRAARTEWPVWEKERLAAMAEVIGPHDVVYDIGAEEGDFPTLWASWGAKVVLVEPNPRVWPNIRFCFEANQLTQSVIGWHVGFCGSEPRAATDWWYEFDGRDEPFADGQQWPLCADGEVIGDHGFLVIVERPDCPVTTIDDLAAMHDPPTVITMDVEGAEFLVLQGAEQVLRAFKPACFVSVHIDMPWLDEKFDGDTGPRIEEFMTSLGYVGRELALDHERHMEYRHPEGR